jgi:large subunit ribosomal protein L24
MRKIKKGDEVVVLTGKYKAKRGTVLKIEDNKAVVEGVNLAKKHVRPNPMAGKQGGIVEINLPIDISNIAIFNPKKGGPDRVGFKILEDGRKVRYFKSDGELVDRL